MEIRNDPETPSAGNTLQDALAPLAEKPKLKTPFLTPDGHPKAWTLHYRYGNIVSIAKNFMMEGHIRDVIVRARKHCELMGYKFLVVRPMMVDLDHQETQYIKSKVRDED